MGKTVWATIETNCPCSNNFVLSFVDWIDHVNLE